MRSVDLFLGLPFDIASYAILQRLVANETGLKSRHLYFNFGDAHIYKNHLQQVATVLSRAPRTAPLLVVPPTVTIDNIQPGDITLINYDSHPSVKAEMNI
jgi:thymidylate synthase